MIETFGESFLYFIVHLALFGVLFWGVVVIIYNKDGGALWLVCALCVLYGTVYIDNMAMSNDVRLIDGVFRSHKSCLFELTTNVRSQPTEKEVEQLFGMALRRHRLVLQQISTVKEPNTRDDTHYRVTVSWYKHQPLLPD